MKTHFLSHPVLFRILTLSTLTAALLCAPVAWAQDDVDSVDVDSAATEDVEVELTDLERAREMYLKVEASVDSVETLMGNFRGATEDDRAVLRSQGRRQMEVITDVQPDALKLVYKLRNDTLETHVEAVDSLRNRMAGLLERQYALYASSIQWYSRFIDDLRDERAQAPAEQLGDLESRIQEGRRKLDGLLMGQNNILVAADSVGINTHEGWTEHDRYIRARAETLVGRLQIAVNLRDRMRIQVSDAQNAKAPDAEISALRTQEQATERRMKGIAESLDETARLLDLRGIETTQYRQFLIKSTGEITKDLLNIKVLVGVMKDAVESTWKWIKKNTPGMLVKLLILMGFVLLFRVGFRIGWWLFKLLRIIHFSRLIMGLIDTIVRPLATIIGLVAGLWFLGVDPTTLLTGMSVAGIIVGLALQDSLSNLAAGFFIMVTRPYDVDDVVVVGGELGTVKNLGLANSTILTFDNRRIMVPNKKIWGDKIENRSAEPIRRVDATFKVGFSEDLEKVFNVLQDLLRADERVLDDPKPYIFIEKVDDSWMQLAVRPWVKNADWWYTLTELPQLIHDRFEKEGIAIPYPQQMLTGDESVFGK